ncbi:DUF1003 domain-containing protein [Chryseobacterium sp. B21-037]|uniref:DUF1003 domain-containing protein n=1 Tax=Chryseobacterium sp. B21-037 TaxID=2926038 RepID=UPI00235989AC|nr:DUF1003 domain-containing protein [Chryseobacterium sp. B21-037]MDC8103125.1 DUF1003 domain-containing protein [Chryseobacterium sp. B21-037]
MKSNTEKTEVLERIANGITWWIGSIPSLIAHTLFFIISFLLPLLHIVEFDKMLLILTTVVSLEAIYLAIFIQMSVNRSHEKIEDIQEDIEDIQEDIEEISEDIEEISEDIEEISEDIEEINEDIEDIQEDIEEINEDEDDEDHNERAKKVILKSSVNSNKNEIKALKDQILRLQNEIDDLKKMVQYRYNILLECVKLFFISLIFI